MSVMLLLTWATDPRISIADFVQALVVGIAVGFAVYHAPRRS